MAIDTSRIWAEVERQHRELSIARGTAINAYAGMEQALCLLLASLIGTDKAIAAIILYRVTATRSRMGIIDKLKKRKHRSLHNVFWNSLLKEIGLIDQGRNELVHWHAMTQISTNPAMAKLTPPGSMWMPPIMPDQTPQELTVEKCVAFGTRCELATEAVRLFLRATDAEYQGPGFQFPPTWLEIFQQPLTHPLKSTHPLARYLVGQRAPRSSSPL